MIIKSSFYFSSLYGYISLLFNFGAILELFPNIYGITKTYMNFYHQIGIISKIREKGLAIVYHLIKKK